MKFEYRIVEAKLHEKRVGAIEAELNAFGGEGWELVAACGVYSQALVFMRAIGPERKTRAKTQ